VTERKRRVEGMLESMGRMVVPVPDESEAEREQVIEGVNRRLELAGQTRRSNVKRRWFAVAAAAALCASAGVSFAHFHKAQLAPQSTIAEAGSGVFKRGDALHTEPQEVRRGTLENGAQVTLSGSTELTVSALVSDSDELVLDRGRVELSVPKLRSGHTLSVTTPDSTVTVRGTRFSVEVVIEGTQAITSVDVTQGSVWVRQADTRLVLGAGSHWSSRVAPPPASAIARSVAPPATSEAARGAASAPGVHAEALPTKAASVPGASAARPETTPQPALESSTLAQENDLYAAASRAAREGNDAIAIADLNGLLSRYPNSPLAQNARVDRFRALNRSGRGQEAVAQARRYLADYPNGFARDEAKAIVLQALASP
jgi:hypothetical protein